MCIRDRTYTIEGANNDVGGTKLATNGDSDADMDVAIDISNILSDNIVITVTNISG